MEQSNIGVLVLAVRLKEIQMIEHADHDLGIGKIFAEGFVGNIVERFTWPRSLPGFTPKIMHVASKASTHRNYPFAPLTLGIFLFPR